MKNYKKGFVVPLIIAIIALLGIGGGTYVYVNKKNTEKLEKSLKEISNSKTATTTNIVGNDKDEHGCIGSAGYSWCEVKNKCLRIWEEKCELISATQNTNSSKSVISIRDQYLNRANEYGQKQDCGQDAMMAYELAKSIDKEKIGSYILYCAKERSRFYEQKNKFESLIATSDQINSIMNKLKIASLYSGLEKYSEAIPLINNIINTFTPEMLGDENQYNIKDVYLDGNGLWQERILNLSYTQLKQKYAEGLLRHIYRMSADGTDGNFQ